MREQTLMLHHTQLRRWPRNMRKRYPLAEIRRMAVSQADRTGRGEPPCVQPLVVTPGPGETGYDSKRHPRLYIVSGHLRHAGNAYLGREAPRLNCLLRLYVDEADMLADMSAENGIRAEIGPVAWAHHFQVQLEAGRSVRQVARDAGRSVHHVREALKLLKLCADAQELIDRGDLPAGAAASLRRIANAAEQSRAAQRFARRGFTARQIEIAVATLVEPRRPPKVQRLVKPPERVRSAPEVPALVGVPAATETTLADLRAAAAHVCAECEIGREHGQAEPAWHLAAAAAGQVCSACDLRTIRGACDACPLPQLLSRVARDAQGLRNGYGARP